MIVRFAVMRVLMARIAMARISRVIFRAVFVLAVGMAAAAGGLRGIVAGGVSDSRIVHNMRYRMVIAQHDVQPRGQMPTGQQEAQQQRERWPLRERHHAVVPGEWSKRRRNGPTKTMLRLDTMQKAVRFVKRPSFPAQAVVFGSRPAPLVVVPVASREA
jgi:hypothetical protein